MQVSSYMTLVCLCLLAFCSWFDEIRESWERLPLAWMVDGDPVWLRKTAFVFQQLFSHLASISKDNHCLIKVKLMIKQKGICKIRISHVLKLYYILYFKIKVDKKHSQ